MLASRRVLPKLLLGCVVGVGCGVTDAEDVETGTARQAIGAQSQDGGSGDAASQLPDPLSLSPTSNLPWSGDLPPGGGASSILSTPPPAVHARTPQEEEGVSEDFAELLGEANDVHLAIESFSFHKSTATAVIAFKVEDLGPNDDGSERYSKWQVTDHLAGAQIGDSFLTISEHALRGRRPACLSVDTPPGRRDLILIRPNLAGNYNFLFDRGGRAADFRGSPGGNFTAPSGASFSHQALESEANLD